MYVKPDDIRSEKPDIASNSRFCQKNGYYYSLKFWPDPKLLIYGRKLASFSYKQIISVYFFQDKTLLKQHACCGFPTKLWSGYQYSTRTHHLTLNLAFYQPFVIHIPYIFNLQFPVFSICNSLYFQNLTAKVRRIFGTAKFLAKKKLQIVPLGLRMCKFICNFFVRGPQRAMLEWGEQRPWSPAD